MEKDGGYKDILFFLKEKRIFQNINIASTKIEKDNKGNIKNILIRDDKKVINIYFSKDTQDIDHLRFYEYSDYSKEEELIKAIFFKKGFCTIEINEDLLEAKFGNNYERIITKVQNNGQFSSYPKKIKDIFLGLKRKSGFNEIISWKIVNLSIFIEDDFKHRIIAICQLDPKNIGKRIFALIDGKGLDNQLITEEKSFKKIKNLYLGAKKDEKVLILKIRTQLGRTCEVNSILLLKFFADFLQKGYFLENIINTFNKVASFDFSLEDIKQSLVQSTIKFILEYSKNGLMRDQLEVGILKRLKKLKNEYKILQNKPGQICSYEYNLVHKNSINFYQKNTFISK